jgi:NMD protein affecting ribosome stability and mRNA decay
MVSVGHKYTTKLPNHRGAPFAGRGWETDYAEKMLEMS